MIKIYCDFCNAEIYDENRFHSTGLTAEIERGQAKLKVLLTVESHSSGIDCCKYCIIKAANKLDDRPREMEHRP